MLSVFGEAYGLISTDPLALVFLSLLVLIAIFGCPVLLRHVKKESRPS